MEIEFKDIIDRRMLANFIGIEYQKLTYVLYSKKSGELYKTFNIPKKSGGDRCINAPIEPLKSIQRKLALKLNDVYERYYLKGNTIVQGFACGRSIITNAKIHRNRRYIVNMDLEDFFDSFHFGRVKGYFQKNKNFNLPEDIAICIANLVCYKGCLPQGASTSPVITNLICAILDRRLAKIAKTYRMSYTRYADDMTFSTNDVEFIGKTERFFEEITLEIEKSGFKINKDKTRVLYQEFRQEVTGLVINNKISVKREFYKETRAMLNYLYRGLNVTCGDVEVSQDQIEGRLAFINQIDWYNNIHENARKTPMHAMNARERQYQQFLFYKYFFRSPKPLIVTEGKTDKIYIRTALQSLYEKYPNLIKRNADGTYDYKISFLSRTPRLDFFLGIKSDGADTMKNIYNEYNGKNSYPNLAEPLLRYDQKPINPVIMVFDNETKSGRPLKGFLEYTKRKLDANLSMNLCENLYLLTIPLVKGKEECEIEDLFDDDVLSHEIDGKRFDRKGKDSKETYSKQIFATYIANNVSAIDFSEFIPMLDELDKIIAEYKQDDK